MKFLSDSPMETTAQYGAKLLAMCNSTHFEPSPRTPQALLERIRLIYNSPGLLHPREKIIWTEDGWAKNRSFNSPNRI